MTEPKFWQDESASKTAKWQPGLSSTILLLLTGVALLTSLLSALINQDASETWWSGFLQNFSTEMMGAIITFILFEQILNRRRLETEKEQQDARDKMLFTVLASSANNTQGVKSIEVMRELGWLDSILDGQPKSGSNWDGIDLSNQKVNIIGMHNGSLKRSNFENADIQGVDFENSDFQHSNLRNVNMPGTDFSGCNLYGANLSGSHLQETKFVGANLKNASLQNCNMDSYIHMNRANCVRTNLRGSVIRGAKFVDANLHEANFLDTTLENIDFTKANLTGARFYRRFGAEIRNAALLNETVILPDGSRYEPEKGIEQMNRFTVNDNKSQNMDYWQMSWVRTGKLPRWLAKWSQTDKS